MTVSVGIPCFNHSKYLKSAVESVLAQTHQDFEIFLLNDGGTDDFNAVAQQFSDPRIKLFAFTENMGVWYAQNRMSAMATGEYYVPFAADDILDPTYLERCLAEFQKNPSLEMVCVHTDFINGAGEPFNGPENILAGIPQIRNLPRQEQLDSLSGGNQYHGVGMYRTKVIAEVGGWETQYKVIADYQMYLKLLQREAYFVIEEVLAHTRVDGKNLSLLGEEQTKELPWLYHLARKQYYKWPVKVSICSQVLNNSAGLKVMIASVINQIYRDWELLIVDDGSEESVQPIIDECNDGRIRLIRLEQNVGVPAGINIAMKQAEGEYIAMLSSDELITPDKLENQVAYMDAHKGVDCVWGLPGKGEFGLRPLWEQGVLRAHNRSNEAWLKTLINLENVPIGGASLLMRTEVMKSLGYMDEKLTSFSDHELYCRFFERHVGVVLPYRWADEQENPGAVFREKNQHRAAEEIAYVREKHKVPLPAITGKVTIGIPCFNDSKFLPDAVGAILAQTYQDWELMILNDGGTDNFKEVIQQFADPRIKVFAFEENSGMWDAWNQMAFRAAGEFFINFAVDDIIEPNFIEKCLEQFAKDPWLEAVASQTDFMNEDKSPLTDPNHMALRVPKAMNTTREMLLYSLHRGNLYFGAGMYRTKVISDLGGWEKQYGILADYQMYLKLLQRERIQVIEEPLTHTRIHEKQKSLLHTAKEQNDVLWLQHAAKKPYYRQLMKVVIATPFYELKGFSPYISSLQATIRALTEHGIDWRFMELSGDSYVHRARNTMCDTFLMDPDTTDLFFIDSDMSWNPDAFVKMCLLPEEAVGGTYPVKNCWDAWTSIPHWHEENGQNVLKGKPLPDGTALIEAQVLAGGFLRLKRSALEKFRAHYKDLWYIEPSSSPGEPGKKFTQFFGAESIDHKFYGEDHMFSRHLREMGIKMYIFPNVDINHWGYKNFPGNYDQYLRQQAKDSKPPPEPIKDPVDRAHTIDTGMVH